jgi:hypothetical protein
MNVKIMYNCNFVCCFVWVWNLICHDERRTQGEGILYVGAEEDVSAQEGCMNRKLEETM